MSTDPVVRDALTQAVPLRTEFEPAWNDVLTRSGGGRSSVPRPAWRPRLASRWALVAALVAAAGLSVGGLAIADAFGPAPLHGAKLVIDPSMVGGANGISTCDLIGKPAGRVETQLSQSGIAVEWRFMHWGTVSTPTAQGSPQGVTGGRSDAVSSVPDESVVWDVVPDGQASAFVFVQAPNDPNAPTVSTENCSG